MCAGVFLMCGFVCKQVTVGMKCVICVRVCVCVCVCVSPVTAAPHHFLFHSATTTAEEEASVDEMDPQTWMCGVLLLAAVFPPTAAGSMYDPQVCYVLDGFLGLYGLIITGMFIKEKFFRPKGKPTEESLYSDLRGQDTGGYAPLMRDPERARNRRMADDDSTYTHLNKSSEGEYKELPVNKRERQRKNEKVYQDLSSATRDTYDSLQMQPLSR